MEISQIEAAPILPFEDVAAGKFKNSVRFLATVVSYQSESKTASLKRPLRSSSKIVKVDASLVSIPVNPGTMYHVICDSSSDLPNRKLIARIMRDATGTDVLRYERALGAVSNDG